MERFGTNIANNRSVIELSYPCLNSNQCHPITAYFPKGQYKFELWGAQGGSIIEGNDTLGGRGGYTSANVTFHKRSKVFINIGGQGICPSSNSSNMHPVFNGGGCGQYYATSIFSGCCGGGATDVRINTNSLLNRFLVAGAGGGSAVYRSEDSPQYLYGGFGGGEVGGDGLSGILPNAIIGKGGDQSSGGTGLHFGSFGFGANITSAYSAGGGGGFYGGGSSFYASAGGGSGYIMPNSSILTIIKNAILDGSTEIPTFQENSFSFGNAGHGAVRITIFSQEPDLFTRKPINFKFRTKFKNLIFS